MLFNGKIYFFGGLREDLLRHVRRGGGGGLFSGQARGGGGLFGGQGIGGGGGGLFAGQFQPENVHGVFVLDLGMILPQQLD